MGVEPIKDEQASQPFGHTTKLGGVVSCVSFELCRNQANGVKCLDCLRNKYSMTKKGDFYHEAAENARGEIQIGNVKVIFGETLEDCKVFCGDEEVKNFGEIHVIARPNEPTQLIIQYLALPTLPQR
jgi:hypothetical protein